MDFLKNLGNDSILAKLIATLVWVALVVSLRAVSLGFVRNQKWSSDEVRLRWHLRIGQSGFMALTIGVFWLWATELQSFALSAVAVAAALVLATKELILCISGSVMRTMTDSYTVGDRIELDGVRGDVINYGLLTTTVLEIGPAHQRTGRAVVLPNSLLLSKPMVNETFTDDYVLHTFVVPLRENQDWKRAEKVLLGIAERVCDQYRETARRHMQALSRRHGVVPPAVEPRVAVQLPEAGEVQLLLRVPTPAQAKGRVEQEILRGFLDEFRPEPTPQA